MSLGGYRIAIQRCGSFLCSSPRQVIQKTSAASSQRRCESGTMTTLKIRGIVLLPVGWENDAYATYQPGERTQGILNKDMVNHCDIVVAVFRARLGTSSGEFESGTVEESEKGP